jgi:hypothetical protein
MDVPQFWTAPDEMSIAKHQVAEARASPQRSGNQSASLAKPLIKMVGAIGFEPMTSTV